MSEIPGVNSAMLASMHAHDSSGGGSSSGSGIPGGATEKVMSSKIGGDVMSKSIAEGSVDHKAPTLGEGPLHQMTQSGLNLEGDVIGAMFGDKPITGNEFAAGIQGGLPQLQHTSFGSGLNAPTGVGIKDTGRSGGGSSH